MNNDLNNGNTVTPPVNPNPAPEPVVNPVPVSPQPMPANPTPVAPQPMPATPVTPQPEPIVEQQPTITINNVPGEVPSTNNTNTNPNNEKKPMDKKMIIYIIIIIILAIVFVFLLLGRKSDEPTPEPTATPEPAAVTGTLLEDVKIGGYQCIDSKCSVSIGEDENEVYYDFGAKNIELFKKLNDYEDYLKVNIYYTKSDDKQTIVDYKIFIKATNEDISSVTNESKLREKLGLYALGNHTDMLTLKEIGMPGVGSVGEETYTFNSYTFTDSNGNEYDMKYKNPPTSLKVTAGTKYKVTFEVVEGTFDYEYNITNIEAAS